MKRALSVAVAGLLLCPSIAPAQIGTAFTYQGRLSDGGGQASGSYDFQLILYDAPAGGSQIGPAVPLDDIAVANGLFTASLDFGAVFTGSKRWLEIGVRAGSSTLAFAILSPRQELTPAPNALFASSAGAADWAGVANKPAGFADGVDNVGTGTVTSVTGIAPLTGTVTTSGALSLTPCPANQIYKTDGAGTAWVCAVDADTTYQPGTGLSLVGMVFSTDNALVARKDAAAGNQAFDTSTLFLDYTNDRIGIGTAAPAAPLDVAGEIRYRGVLKVGLAAPTPYEASALRYVVEAPPANVGVVVPFDSSLTDQLCRDKDGCEVTLQMINYDLSMPGQAASRAERLFISETSRWWRFSNNDVSGQDNNGGIQEWLAYDCALTDAETPTGPANGRTDAGPGLALLNVAGGSYSDITTTCRVVIVD